MSQNFVLAADEVWRLQGGRNGNDWRAAGGDDPECLCFQKMAGRGHYGPGGGTKQGIYVCTSGGEFLASINSSSPSAVLAMLQRGLDAWKKLPEDSRRKTPPVSKPTHRWEYSYPDDGLVLKETIRYLSPAGPSKESRFNFDFAWFSADEAKRLIPDSAQVGQTHSVAEDLFHRLAGLHLLNTAQGESGPYHADELTGQLVVEVLEVNNDNVRIRIEGTSQAIAQTEHDAHWRVRRIDAELLGFAVFDFAAKRFSEFELVAIGKLFPKTDSDAQAAQPIGWHFTLADPRDPREKISPTHMYAYQGDWIVKPNIALHGLQRSSSDEAKMKNGK